MTATDTRPTPATRPRSGFDVGLVVAGIVLVILGTLWLIDATGLAQLPAAVVLPSLLTAVGLAVMAGSFQGHHPGLVTTGVLLAVATVFAALAPAEALRGGLGQRTISVDQPSDLANRYSLAVGELTLDLRHLDLNGHRRVELSVGTGTVVVRLPEQVDVSVDAAVAAGQVDLLGDRADGVAVERSAHSQGDENGHGSLQLDIEMGAGSIEVTR